MSAVVGTPASHGGLLRVTRSAPFRVLFALACVVVVPVLALGMLFSVFIVLGGQTGDDFWAGAGVVAATGAGAAGMLGLARSRGSTATASAGRVRLTLALLAIGILGAFGIVGGVAALAVADFGWSGATGIVVAAVGLPLAILVVDGCACLQYLIGSSNRGADAGLDGLPLSFLGLALVSAASVLLIMLGM